MLGDQPLFFGTAAQYRRRWGFLLATFKISTSLRLTPGGLRGGFAVFSYRQERMISQIQWDMRLRHMGTLESYLQETGTLTIYNQLSSESRKLLKTASMLFQFLTARMVPRADLT